MQKVSLFVGFVSPAHFRHETPLFEVMDSTRDSQSLPPGINFLGDPILGLLAECMNEGDHGDER